LLVFLLLVFPVFRQRQFLSLRVCVCVCVCVPVVAACSEFLRSSAWERNTLACVPVFIGVLVFMLVCSTLTSPLRHVVETIQYHSGSQVLSTPTLPHCGVIRRRNREHSVGWRGTLSTLCGYVPVRQHSCVCTPSMRSFLLTLCLFVCVWHCLRVIVGGVFERHSPCHSYISSTLPLSLCASACLRSA
jgi:hypothetical protein